MLLHRDLLEQAFHLAQRDRKKPRQANLRRAISAGYYALFHALIDRAGKCLLGTQPAGMPYRDLLGRAFSHSVMKSTCEFIDAFQPDQPKTHKLRGLPADFEISESWLHVARTFIEAQEKRHLADYDCSLRLNRQDVRRDLREVELALDRLEALPQGHVQNFLFACMLAWNGLKKR